jgi:uncharacterized protein YndB with AHSA1/START domain
MNVKHPPPRGRHNGTHAALCDAFGAGVPPEEHVYLEQVFDGFRRDLVLHPYVQSLAGGGRARARLRNLGLAVGALAAGLLLAAGLFLTRGAPAWADVARSFSSVAFVNATLYVKEDALSQPEQIELWLARGGRTRMRVGSQVVFAGEGGAARAFDVDSRREVDPDYRALQVMESFGGHALLSLDDFIRALPGTPSVQATPELNPRAAASDDMVAFDVRTSSTPEWLRVWALRESRLPVRLLARDPRDGGSTDVLFGYGERQPDPSFAPDAFAAELQKGDWSTAAAGLAYALLHDPGGQPVTPRQLFERGSGCHVPAVEAAGMTEDGLVWVVAARSMNLTAGGRPFYGFATLEDDLGRDYRQVWCSTRATDDRCLQVFMPSDYPFDSRVPQRLTLTCRTEEYGRRETPEVVATIDVTEFQHGATWPEHHDAHGFAPLVAAAGGFLARGDYDRFEKVMAMIPGDPSDDRRALAREQLRLRMLVRTGDYEAAIALGERLTPLLEREYVRWKGSRTTPHLFNDYLVALAAGGRLERAGECYRSILALEPDVPENLDRRARSALQRHHDDEVIRNTADLADRFAAEAGMTVEQINAFFGADVDKDERVKRLRARDPSESHGEAASRS